MIKSLSDNITDYFYLNKVIKEEEKEIYTYGLQLIISTIIGITLIASLGLILNELVQTLAFLITFISIRMYSGGYHSNSYLKCNLTLNVIYLIIILTSIFTPYNYINIFSIIMACLTIIIIIKFAPVENVNKTLTSTQAKKNKKIAIFLLISFYLISFILYKLNIQIFYTIILTMFSVAILIFIKVKGVH